MGIWRRASSPMRSGPVLRATASRTTSGWCRCGSQPKAVAKTLRKPTKEYWFRHSQHRHRMVCNMGASLYEPINVYKPVASNIGIVDGPFEYLTIGGAKLPLPFTTRMTVVRLSNDDLFLHSPIKFDVRLANELLGLGAVRHLVSPNQFHYAHIGEWAKAFPNAVSWASPRVRERARARHVDVDFTRDLEASPPEEWRREI